MKVSLYFISCETNQKQAFAHLYLTVMSRNVSIDQRYSEGELSSSPDYQALKEMDEYESRYLQ